MLGNLQRRVIHNLLSSLVAQPSPVEGPQVDVAVVDVSIGTDARPAAEVVLATPRALAAHGDEMVLVE